jgi:hypothetical protein
MKKLMLLLAVASFTMAGTTSCNKCIECTHPVFGDYDEYCGKGSVVRSAYKSSMESSGYNCK